MINFRWNSTALAFAPFFSFDNAAGTTSALASAEQNVVAEMGQVQGSAQFVSGPGGSVLWGASALEPVGLGYGTKAARLAWLLDDDQDTTFSAKTRVDIETYTPTAVSAGSVVIGPMAAIDATTALVLAANPQNLGQTSVQVAVRLGLAASIVSNRRFVVVAPQDKVAATAADGFGYVLAADAPDSATVHVFAPGCN
jgi:hypothetical protein